VNCPQCKTILNITTDNEDPDYVKLHCPVCGYKDRNLSPQGRSKQGSGLCHKLLHGGVR